MKKILALILVFGMGALASVAQAQEMKSYVILGYGVIASSGGATVTQPYIDGTVVTTEYSEAGGYLRLGYGYYLNETLSLEASYIDIAGINGKVTVDDSKCVNIICFSGTAEGGVAVLSTTEFAAVYYKPLNEKTNLTLRGGLVSYSWSGVDDVELEGFKTTSGTTPVLGVGAEVGNWQFELLSYDFTLTDSEGDDIYTGPLILSAGYKFRF